MGVLHIGTLLNGKPFTLPEDLGDKKIALLAQSNKGKTYGLGDILEELAEAQRPFIATDPANNLWGLRVLPDGRPSGLQVVVIGGDHADIPFEKEQGERMADLLLSTPTCAVIDVAFESQGATRRFMTDFAGRLMRTKPEIPRVVVLEECPVLIPQNAFGVQAQVCKAAVSKLATIGGNFGYGVIPACQRPATMDKDVLSQCEALIVMGITHKQDRKTVREWMEAKDIGERAAKAFAQLGSLKPGEAWFWWPSEDRFEFFTFRKRRTLHPREMKKLGLKQTQIRLGDMNAFVELAKRELTKTSVSVLDVSKKGHIVREPEPPKVSLVRAAEFDRLTKENEDLRSKLEDLNEKYNKARHGIADADRRLTAVRETLRPQYDSLRTLFDALTTVSGAGRGAVDRGPFMKWLEKAPKLGMKAMLEHLIENGSATRQQLATIAGVARTTSYDYVAWILRNQLAEDDGNRIVLRKM
jgi:hypothetical protein